MADEQDPEQTPRKLTLGDIIKPSPELSQAIGRALGQASRIFFARIFMTYSMKHLPLEEQVKMIERNERSVKRDKRSVEPYYLSAFLRIYMVKTHTYAEALELMLVEEGFLNDAGTQGMYEKGFESAMGRLRKKYGIVGNSRGNSRGT